MYNVYPKKCSGITTVEEIKNINGYCMTSKGRGFTIYDSFITNIVVVNRKLGYGVVTKKVLDKYYKLIALLTELLVSDDDSGESFREALNHIEKFRLEIKIKYREFLKKKELELMSKQLVALKKEAEKRLIEINDSYMEMKSSGKGR